MSSQACADLRMRYCSIMLRECLCLLWCSSEFPLSNQRGKQSVMVSVLRVMRQTDRHETCDFGLDLEFFRVRWIRNNTPDDAPGYPVANRIGHGGEFQYGERSNVCHLKKESERRINWIWCSTVSEMLCWRICRDPSENTDLAEVPPHSDFSFA